MDLLSDGWKCCRCLSRGELFNMFGICNRRSFFGLMFLLVLLLLYFVMVRDGYGSIVGEDRGFEMCYVF